jgi:hypothetical protein
MKIERKYKTGVEEIDCGDNGWPHTEHRLRMFQNKIMRRISGPKADKVPGSWRKVHAEELHNILQQLSTG